MQLKSLEEDKKKLEGVVGVLEKKVKDTLKGQGSRDALIETLQGKIQELQQQVDELKVTTDSVSLWNCLTMNLVRHPLPSSGATVVQRVRHLGLRSVGRGFKSC